jgi:P-type conjugative transfer protein TrbJ
MNTRQWIGIGLVGLLIFVGAGSRTARGQALVLDVANLGYQILNYAYDLSDIVAQAEQIAHLIIMVEQGITNLDPSDIPIIGPLFEAWAVLLDVFHRAEGIVFRLGAVEPQFTLLYPEFGGPAVDHILYVEQQRAWNLQVRHAHLTAMESHGIHDLLPDDMATLGETLRRSDAAAGNLEVTQEGNKITAIVATQLMRLQEMEAAQGRAVASKLMMEAAENDAAISNSKRWIGDQSLVLPTPGLAELPTLR